MRTIALLHFTDEMSLCCTRPNKFDRGTRWNDNLSNDVQQSTIALNMSVASSPTVFRHIQKEFAKTLSISYTIPTVER